MKRLYLLALLFLTLLVLDEAFGAYHKSSKEGKKKKKAEGESQEAKKRYDGSPKQHKRKTREVPADIEENGEENSEVEEKEAFKSSKETRKHYGKEEAKSDKYTKKKKQSEEESLTKDKKKSGKKCNEWKQKKNIQDEEIGGDDENVEPVYVTKGKKKSIKKIEPELKQKYNGKQTNNEERHGKTCCNAQDDLEVEPETEVDVTRVQSKKTPRVQRYIEETAEEEEEGNELESLAEEKCYYP